MAEATKNKKETCADGQEAKGYIEKVKAQHKLKIASAQQVAKDKKKVLDTTTSNIDKIRTRVTDSQKKLTTVTERRDKEKDWHKRLCQDRMLQVKKIEQNKMKIEKEKTRMSDKKKCHEDQRDARNDVVKQLEDKSSKIVYQKKIAEEGKEKAVKNLTEQLQKAEHDVSDRKGVVTRDRARLEDASQRHEGLNKEAFQKRNAVKQQEKHQLMATQHLNKASQASAFASQTLKDVHVEKKTAKDKRTDVAKKLMQSEVTADRMQDEVKAAQVDNERKRLQFESRQLRR